MECLEQVIFGHDLNGCCFEIVGETLSQHLDGLTGCLGILRPQI
jgi:hypothetical protein